MSSISRVFTKENSSQYADHLFKEVAGLAMLQETIDAAGLRELATPRVISVDEYCLEVERVTPASPSDSHMKRLGEALAKLHNQRFEKFGLDHDNYIGLNPQPNTWYQSWGEFFVEQRLGFQLTLIEDPNVADRFQAILNDCREGLARYLNAHCRFASLLHGDLWSGNVLFGQKQNYLIDPAVYYGDREADIAMTEMFGGFSRVFYSAYENQCPLTSEYKLKREIYNLYHYLNHYNLFGDSYLPACSKRFELIQGLAKI